MSEHKEKFPSEHLRVAVSGVVTNADGDILVIRSPEAWRGWELPGGCLHTYESLHEGLQREVFEETGTSIQITSLAAVYSNVQSGGLVFLFNACYDGGELRPSVESVEVKWIAREEVIARLTQPQMKDRVRDGLEYNGYLRYRVYEHRPYRVVDQFYLNKPAC